MQFWPWNLWCVQHCVRSSLLLVTRSCLWWGSPASLFFPSLGNSSKWMKLTIFYLCRAAFSGTPRFSESIMLLHISIETNSPSQDLWMGMLKAAHTSATVRAGVMEQSLVLISSSLGPKTVLKSLPWSCLKSVPCFCCRVPLLLIS